MLHAAEAALQRFDDVLARLLTEVVLVDTDDDGVVSLEQLRCGLGVGLRAAGRRVSMSSTQIRELVGRIIRPYKRLAPATSATQCTGQLPATNAVRIRYLDAMVPGWRRAGWRAILRDTVSRGAGDQYDLGDGQGRGTPPAAPRLRALLDRQRAKVAKRRQRSGRTSHDRGLTFAPPSQHHTRRLTFAAPVGAPPTGLGYPGRAARGKRRPSRSRRVPGRSQAARSRSPGAARQIAQQRATRAQRASRRARRRTLTYSDMLASSAPLAPPPPDTGHGHQCAHRGHLSHQCMDPRGDAQVALSYAAAATALRTLVQAEDFSASGGGTSDGSDEATAEEEQETGGDRSSAREREDVVCRLGLSHGEGREFVWRSQWRKRRRAHKRAMQAARRIERERTTQRDQVRAGGGDEQSRDLADLELRKEKRRSVIQGNALAMKHFAAGDYQQCLHALRALQPDRIPIKAMRILTLNNIACAYHRMGATRLALRALTRAERVGHIGEHIENRAITHMNLCAVLSDSKRHAEALTHATKAWAVRDGELWDASVATGRGSARSHAHVCWRR